MVELLTEMIAFTFAIVQAYGPYSVFLIVILEEVLVPIPSVLVLMGAGFILIDPNLSLVQAMIDVFLIIVIPASVASTIGSFFMYGIGYFGGRPLITRFHRFLGVKWEDIEKTEKKFEKGKRIWVTVALLRAIPFFPIALVSLTSGVLRLSWKKYAIATFVGSVPRTFILGLIGWQVGAAYVNVADRLNFVEDVIIVTIVAVIAYAIYRSRHKFLKKKSIQTS